MPPGQTMGRLRLLAAMSALSLIASISSSANILQTTRRYILEPTSVIGKRTLP